MRLSKLARTQHIPYATPRHSLFHRRSRLLIYVLITHAHAHAPAAAHTHAHAHNSHTHTHTHTHTRTHTHTHTTKDFPIFLGPREKKHHNPGSESSLQTCSCKFCFKVQLLRCGDFAIFCGKTLKARENRSSMKPTLALGKGAFPSTHMALSNL